MLDSKIISRTESRVHDFEWALSLTKEINRNKGLKIIVDERIECSICYSLGLYFIKTID